MDAKIWVLLAIVITVQCRDITEGSINGGHKIYDENKQASPALWRRIENVTIAANESEIISGIIVTDLREEKDGDAKIVEGGEGQNNVTIELKSPAVLRGFDFHIEAYAIPKSQQKSTEHEIKTFPSDKSTENSKPETSLNTDASIPISLAKNEISSSSESSIESSTNIEKKINQRQNRDTEKIDKSTQETNPAQSFTDKSTTIVPEGRESHTLVNKYTSTQVPEQRHDFHVPKLQLHEFSRMPESTARNVPISDLKKMEDTNYNRDHEIYGDNKRYTHVDYPQFTNNRDNNELPVPAIVNIEMPTIENNNKNKNLRKKRDLGNEQHNPVINDKEGLTSFPQRLTNDDNTAEIYKSNSQTEESINAATTKSERITEKQGNLQNNSEVTDSVKTDNSANVSKLIEDNNRNIRDTTMVNTNDKKETLLSPIDILDDSKYPITTFTATSDKPKMDQQNALKINDNNKVPQSNLKIPTVLHSDTDDSVNDDNTTVVTVETEDMERNSRDTVSDTKNEMLSFTKVLKPTNNINITSNQNKSVLTTNLENFKLGQVTGETTIEPHENIDVPVEFKYGVSDSAHLVNLTTDASQRSKQNERKTRDTKEVNKTDNNNNEKLSPNTDMDVSAEITTKTQKMNTGNIDSKSAITSKIEAKKTITDKDEKLQQIPIVATVLNTTESKINPKFAMKNIPQQFTKTVSVKENSQSPKTPRDIKETDTVGPKNASIEELNSDIPRKDIKVSYTDSTFIVTPARSNKEQAKILKNTSENNNNESTEKSVPRE